MKLDINPKPDITETLEMNRSHMLGKRLKKYLIIALVALLAVAAVIIWKTAGTRTAPQYKTEQVRRGELTVIVTATGTLQPTNTVSVGSELSGITKSVEVNYNDRVKIGQVLARLDTSKLEAQLTQSKAALERAKAEAAGAAAAVSQSEAILQANETDLSKSIIRSPINGVVLTRSIDPGQTVAASFQAPVLLTLAQDMTQMELHVNVDEADTGKIRGGQ